MRAASGGLWILAVVVGFVVVVLLVMAVIFVLSVANVSHHTINPPAGVQTR